MEKFLQEVGARVKEARMRKHLSQAQAPKPTAGTMAAAAVDTDAVLPVPDVDRQFIVESECWRMTEDQHFVLPEFITTVDTVPDKECLLVPVLVVAGFIQICRCSVNKAVCLLTKLNS